MQGNLVVISSDESLREIVGIGHDMVGLSFSVFLNLAAHTSPHIALSEVAAPPASH